MMYPDADGLFEALQEFLRTDLPSGDFQRFQARVAGNVVATLRREWAQGDAAAAAEQTRLAALLGRDGDLTTLNRDLVARIREGEIDWTSQALLDHLDATLAAELAINNPKWTVGKGGKTDG
jgi:hypothetical protein